MRNPIIPLLTRLDKVIVKAKDCLIYDSEGNQYLDFESGDWAAILGHSNDRIVRVINEQVERVIHDGLQFRNRESEDLSLALLEVLDMPGGQSIFLNSGSEAVNLSITLAKNLTKRRKVLKINETYISAYGHGRISAENEDLLNIPMDDVDAIAEHDFQEIAAFVFEPGNSKSLIKYPSAAFVEVLAEKAAQNGCLLIVNEVTAGFGRTGKWFGHQHYNVRPDIVAMGKGLGNGYPISAVSISGRVASMFEKEPFRYAQSHQNDPLGCAVGLAVINTMQDLDLVEASFEKGEYFNAALAQLQAKYPGRISEVRARGLMIGLEFDAPVDVGEIHAQLLDRGFIAGAKEQTMRFMPPLVITKADIDRLIQELDEVL